MMNSAISTVQKSQGEKARRLPFWSSLKETFFINQMTVDKSMGNLMRKA